MLRNAGLAELADALQKENARKVDITTPLSNISFDAGQMVVRGSTPLLTPDGVVNADGAYSMTGNAESDIANRLGVPASYLRSLGAAGLVSLYDHNLNELADYACVTATGNNKSVPSMFLRCLTGDDGGPGIVRGALSDRYRTIDNLDVLVALLTGVRDADPDADVITCDLSETRMYVRIASPGIKAMAPELLRGYRSPFDADGNITRAGGGEVERWRAAAAREGQGYTPGSEPVVFAGLDVSNSELGKGSFKITPMVIVQICKNGLRLPLKALKERHIGSKLDAGVQVYSDRTQNAELELVTSQAVDAVKTFLSPEFLRQTVEEISAEAGTPITRPEETVRQVAAALRYPKSQREGILQHFVVAGQCTAGGVLNAVTSFAQTLSNADDARDLEDSALPAMAAAARSARSMMH